MTLPAEKWARNRWRRAAGVSQPADLPCLAASASSPTDHRALDAYHMTVRTGCDPSDGRTRFGEPAHPLRFRLSSARPMTSSVTLDPGESLHGRVAPPPRLGLALLWSVDEPGRSVAAAPRLAASDVRARPGSPAASRSRGCSSARGPITPPRRCVPRGCRASSSMCVPRPTTSSCTTSAAVPCSSTASRSSARASSPVSSCSSAASRCCAASPAPRCSSTRPTGGPSPRTRSAGPTASASSARPPRPGSSARGSTSSSGAPRTSSSAAPSGTGKELVAQAVHALSLRAP